tara:strand:- start:102 stop:566 length:465 start_codon:yes stop_codon:yes gene_type:complete
MSGDPHSLDVFSGESIIKGLSRKVEKAKLLDMQKILGLESFNLAEMIILCAAIGLYKTEIKNDSIKSGTFKKLTNIGVFEDRKLYDRILKTKCNVEKPILDDFNRRAYTGYLHLRDWSAGYDPSSFKLEAWSKLIEDVLGDDDPLKDKFKAQQS